MKSLLNLECGDLSPLWFSRASAIVASAIVASAIVVLLLGLGCVSLAQERSPHAGQEKREIKALSEDEVQSFLKGEGMGLAKAAELNRYPGPKHVLELQKELALSDKQLEETRRAFDSMKVEAVRLGIEIVEKERELDRMFAHGASNADHIGAVVADIGTLQSRLRLAHLKAHLEMKRVLTAEQIDKYVKLRGYDSGSHSGQHDHRSH